MVIISQSLNLWAQKEKNNSHFTGHHSSHNTNIYNPPYYYYYSYICQRGAEKRRTCNRKGVSEHNIFITCWKVRTLNEYYQFVKKKSEVQSTMISLESTHHGVWCNITSRAIIKLELIILIPKMLESNHHGVWCDIHYRLMLWSKYVEFVVWLRYLINDSLDQIQRPKFRMKQQHRRRIQSTCTSHFFL
jgi:hypothetical protein